jgi:2-polyprenyl-6-methoxyphenol hydroxylase-like FAD-dependent oxidoreductase
MSPSPSNADALATQVLVCGAGPTGLVLALRLQRSGVRVRIVDAAAEPGTTSRALVVHARTLEFYRQMGLSDAFLEEGLRFVAANLWVRGRHVRRIELGEIGTGISAFPYMLVVPQDRRERFLIEHLRRAGLEVERGTEHSASTKRPTRVRARLRTEQGVEATCEAAYLAGCDGARSRSRESPRRRLSGSRLLAASSSSRTSTRAGPS